MRKAKNIKDLTGEKFGIFTVISRTEKPEHLKKKESYWLCRCKCGSEKVFPNSNLTRNYVRCNECGKSNDVDGTLRLRNIWSKMISRCNNENDVKFAYYGARGIEVDHSWLEFKNFYNDMITDYNTHVSNHGEKNTTLERNDVDGNYSKSNCRWATIEEQNMNKRTTISVEVNGEMKSLKELSEQTGIQYKTLQYRHKRGKRGAELIAPIKK